MCRFTGLDSGNFVYGMNPRELHAMISLLDDPDEGVFHQVREKLLSLGEEVIPLLESAWEESFNSVIQQRIEAIIHHIQFERVRKSLAEWSDHPEQDLLEGSLIIAHYQYPDLDEVKIKNSIEQIKQDIWLELNDNLTALEKVKVVNHILFNVHSYSGNTSNYHAPQNSYINNVLESKRGNPLSLCVLYTIVAQGLGIPVAGINLPEHFILGYKDDQFGVFSGEAGKHGVLFYINPFSKGSVFGKKDIDHFLKQLKLEPRDIFYEPCSNADIIRRMIRNLINSYEKLGYPHKVEELNKLLGTLEGK